MTGGYGGLMEAVSRGAHEGGGHVIGVTAPTVFPRRSGANQYVAEEIPAPSLIERIGILIDGSDGSIALPGSLGTMTELLVAWNLAYVDAGAEGRSKPIVAVGEPWDGLIRHLELDLSITPGLVDLAEDVDQAVHLVSARLH